MRIMAVIPSLSRGGAERVLSTLSREWSKSHDVIVVVFDGAVREFECGGRKIDLRLRIRDGLGRKAYLSVSTVVALVWQYWRARPDRVISFMEPANFPAALSAVISGVADRLTVSVHHNPLTLPPGRRVLMRWIYRIPKRVVGVSEGVSNILRSLGIPKARVMTIPNPVERPSTIRSEISPLNLRYVLGAGRLCPEKGFERLLKAFSYVPLPDLHLVILGDGEERGRLRNLSRKLGIEQRVHLPGEVSNVTPWYQHAECFGLSSFTEAWGLVLVEAMANGCPVVSYDCDFGPSEIITHNQNGLLVPDGDIRGLGSAIERVVTNKQLQKRLASGGKKRAMSFDTTTIAARWLD